jgi:hypothetical protein
LFTGALALVACNGGPDPADAAPTPCTTPLQNVAAEYTACSAAATGTDTCAACTQPTIALAETVTCACYELPKDCYVGAPPDASVKVPNRPGPAPACCSAKLSFDPKGHADGIPTTKPGLEIELGRWDKCAQRFVPYQNKQWTELVMGSQGLFHVHAGLRVHLPGRTGNFAYVQLVAAGLDGCVPTARAFAAEMQLSPDPDKADWWVFKQQNRRGKFTIFPKEIEACQACRFCGRWLDLRVAVRDNTTGAWGEASVLVRTYLQAINAEKCLGKYTICKAGR